MRRQHIRQTQTIGGKLRTLGARVHAGETARSGVSQGIDRERVGQRIVQHTLVIVVERATRRDGTADTLQLDVCNTDAASVFQKGRGVGVRLGLNDLVKDGVDVGCGDVGAVAVVVAQRADEGRVVGLLDDGGCAAGDVGAGDAEEGFELAAVVVRGDADGVAEMLAVRGPVLQRPLAVERTGRPGDGGDLRQD